MQVFPQRTDHQNPLLGTPLTTTVVCTVDNTKGSWTELVSSTPRAASGIRLVFVVATGNTTRDSLVDIGIGGAGSESVKIPNIFLQSMPGSTFGQGFYFEFPLQIPAGSRVAARIQNTATSGSNESYYVFAYLMHGPMETCAVFTSVGANTADSGGTSVDPGATANTKPLTYTELTSGLSLRTKKLWLFIGNRTNADPIVASWKVDVALGASSSEQIILPDLAFIGSVNDAIYPRWYELDVDIPASTRISVRASCTTNNATDRLIDILAIAGSAGPVI